MPVIPVVLGGTHRIGRGSPFTVDLLEPLDPGPAIDDPFTPAGRVRADDLVSRYAALVAAILPERTAGADRDRPARGRWRWLATLFH